MPISVSIIAIAVLFYVLGRSADLIVGGIRDMSEKLGIRVFVLGIVLGFFTSVPELSIAVHSVVNNLPRLSAGNLIGGIFVLFGFVLGGSIIVQRSIATDRIIRAFIPTALFIFLPIILALDGRLTAIDGWILIIGYVLSLTYLYLQFQKEGERMLLKERDGIFRIVSMIACGVVLVGATSYALMYISTALLQRFALPPFLVGLLVFSFGTNLPEILVTVRSWRRHIRELSVSNLFGSALANVFIIGLTAASRTVPFTVNLQFYLLALLMATLLVSLVVFSYTRLRLTRWEGVALLGLYLLFVLLHSGLLVAHCSGVVECQ